jgi:hypothetical protein
VLLNLFRAVKEIRVPNFYCRVGRRHQPARFRFDDFIHSFKWISFNIAVTIVSLSWLIRSTWHETGLAELLHPVQKAQAAGITDMSAKKCHVSITDASGTQHLTEVEAGSLYLVMARGLRSIRDSIPADAVTSALSIISTCDIQPYIEHKISVGELEAWLDRKKVEDQISPR